MPELPDVIVYREALERVAVDRTLEGVRLASPFVLRTVDPPIEALVGLSVVGAERMGKRLVLSLEGDLYLVFHLMIAGRLRWQKRGASIKARGALGGFDFEHGTLMFTEASKKKRASLHVVAGRSALLEHHDRGGLDPRTATLEAFAERLRLENRTLKRALVDPRLFDGIGNAYSDEILHRARMSPFLRTADLDDAQVAQLHDALIATLQDWLEHHRKLVGDGFPDKVTAFHEGMAVHGKFKQPCPVCGAPIQRVVYAENEMNYCAGCQTEGRLLADRALSRLLKADWPKNLDEL